jgi:hypothetical protein
VSAHTKFNATSTAGSIRHLSCWGPTWWELTGLPQSPTTPAQHRVSALPTLSTLGSEPHPGFRYPTSTPRCMASLARFWTACVLWAMHPCPSNRASEREKCDETPSYISALLLLPGLHGHRLADPWGPAGPTQEMLMGKRAGTASSKTQPMLGSRPHGCVPLPPLPSSHSDTSHPQTSSHHLAHSYLAPHTAMNSHLPSFTYS